MEAGRFGWAAIAAADAVCGGVHCGIHSIAIRVSAAMSTDYWRADQNRVRAPVESPARQLTRSAQATAQSLPIAAGDDVHTNCD